MMPTRCSQVTRVLMLAALSTLAESPAHAAGGGALHKLQHDDGFRKLLSDHPVIQVLFIIGLVIYACYKLIVFITEEFVQSKLWYYQIKGGAEEGPVDEAAIRQLVLEGKLNRGDLMRRANGIFWIPAEAGRAGAVTGLAEASSAGPAQAPSPGLRNTDLHHFDPDEDDSTFDPLSRADSFTSLGHTAAAVDERPEAAEPPPLPERRPSSIPPPLPKKRARSEPPPLPRRTARS